MARSFVKDVAENLEPMLMLGAVGYLIYWIGSGKAAAFVGPGITNLLPQQTTSTPVAQTSIPGTDATYFKPSRSSHTLVVVIGGQPEEFGGSYEVPGTDQTIDEMRANGFTDDEIASLIVPAIEDPGQFQSSNLPPAGGAGGSW